MSSNKVFEPSVKALRSEGVSCTFREVIQGRDGTYVATNATTSKKIRFSNRVLADIEDQYGSANEWMATMEDKPNSVILNTLVIVFGLPRDEVGEMIDTKATEEYQFALATAWLLSMGAEDNADLGKLVDRGQKIAEMKPQLLDELIKSFLPDYLGEIGSVAGYVSDLMPTDSGNTPTAKPSSSSVNEPSSTSSTEDSTKTDQTPTPSQPQSAKTVDQLDLDSLQTELQNSR